MQQQYGFCFKKAKTNLMKKSITYYAASIWNDLPKCAKQKGISEAK